MRVGLRVRVYESGCEFESESEIECERVSVTVSLRVSVCE